ncbi:MAG: hypothetical protein U5K79_24360 [Cyclobacteriaceae bacterium]|nr:hypothetical protein [Cyclobacteriaceae bacterium]
MIEDVNILKRALIGTAKFVYPDIHGDAIRILWRFERNTPDWGEECTRQSYGADDKNDLGDFACGNFLKLFFSFALKK